MKRVHECPRCGEKVKATVQEEDYGHVVCVDRKACTERDPERAAAYDQAEREAPAPEAWIARELKKKGGL